MRRSILLTTVVGLALALSACTTAAPDSGDGSDQPVTTLKVGTFPISEFGAIQLGIDKGFFEEEGLELEFTTLANTPAGVAAVQSGQLDVTNASIPTLVTSLAGNVPLTVVAGSYAYPDDALDHDDLTEVDNSGLLVGPDSGITRPRDLEGKSVALNSRGGLHEFAISNLIVEDGGDPSKVEWIILDATSSLQALAAGQVAAAAEVQPFLGQGIAAGNEVLVSHGVEFFGNGGVSSVWLTSDSVLDSKRDAILAFQRAIYRSNTYANEHQDEAQEAAAKFTERPLADIQANAPDHWAETVTIADIEKVNDAMAKIGFIPEPLDLSDDLILK